MGRQLKLHPSFENGDGEAAPRPVEWNQQAGKTAGAENRGAEITTENARMEDWVYVLIDLVLAVVLIAFGFIIGYCFGHRHGWYQASSYHNGYRSEDSEIINRLRGRIIWLEATIKEARERLERVENEP